MGFFGDLKNKVTGGAAQVTVQMQAAKRGAATPVRVQAVAKSNGKVASVYVLVRGTESASWKADNQTVGNSHQSFDTKIVLAGAQDIVAGQTYTWDGQVELPANVHPSVSGKLIEHRWEVQAGLDMPGNDPDSGWQSFQVS